MHIMTTFPLVTALVAARLVRFERSQEEAALDLGASQFQMMTKVVLPQLAPALAASLIFAFAWSFNNFEISFFTGGYDQTFPVWVYGVLRNSNNLPLVNAMSTLISRRSRSSWSICLWWGIRRVVTAARGGRRAFVHGHQWRALMETTSVKAADRQPTTRHWSTSQAGRAARSARWLPAAYLTVPMLMLLLLFVVPMVLVALISVGKGINGAESMWSIDAYTSLLSDPLYLSIAKTTIVIATSAMLIQLVIGVPLAYVMAFKAGRFEIPMLLGLVILDELNPVVRIYAWRMLLGRNGIINGALEWLGIIDQPHRLPCCSTSSRSSSCCQQAGSPTPSFRSTPR